MHASVASFCKCLFQPCSSRCGPLCLAAFEATDSGDPGRGGGVVVVFALSQEQLQQRGRKSVQFTTMRVRAERRWCAHLALVSLYPAEFHQDIHVHPLLGSLGHLQFPTSRPPPRTGPLEGHGVANRPLQVAKRWTAQNHLDNQSCRRFLFAGV